jgi:probable phosphomutase (TIGR03848 family)
MARLLLIRHAVTDETGKVLSGRLPGRPLNPLGVEMANQLAERLSMVKLAAVYASPLERTMETAAPLAANKGRQVVAEPGLIETDYGSWSGRNLRSLYRLRLWQVVVSSPSRIRFPGGESLLEMQQRMVATIEDLARRHRKQTIALVSHADPIKAAVSHYLGQPLDLFNRLDISPASVTILNLSTGRPPHWGTINNSGDPGSWD